MRRQPSNGKEQRRPPSDSHGQKRQSPYDHESRRGEVRNQREKNEKPRSDRPPSQSERSAAITNGHGRRRDEISGSQNNPLAISPTPEDSAPVVRNRKPRGQNNCSEQLLHPEKYPDLFSPPEKVGPPRVSDAEQPMWEENTFEPITTPPCLLYTSPSPRDATLSRMPSSA